MNSNDWPLVFFTLLTQWGVGLVLAGLMTWFLARQAEPPLLETLRKTFSLVALLTMGLALLLSFAHLANPRYSVYALGNLGSSWLSREILLASLLLFLLALSHASARFGFPRPPGFQILWLLALITGMALVWSMARLYMIPTVPLWNSPTTPLGFYASVALLGGSAGLALLAMASGGSMHEGGVQAASIWMMILTATGLLLTLLIPLLFPGDAAAAGGFPPPAWSWWWQAIRWFLLAFGIAMLAWWYFAHLPGGGNEIRWPVLAFVFLMMAEICGRYLFYANYHRVGV